MVLSSPTTWIEDLLRAPAVARSSETIRGAHQTTEPTFKCRVTDEGHLSTHARRRCEGRYRRRHLGLSPSMVSSRSGALGLRHSTSVGPNSMPCTSRPHADAVALPMRSWPRLRHMRGRAERRRLSFGRALRNQRRWRSTAPRVSLRLSGSDDGRRTRPPPASARILARQRPRLASVDHAGERELTPRSGARSRRRIEVPGQVR